MGNIQLHLIIRDGRMLKFSRDGRLNREIWPLNHRISHNINDMDNHNFNLC